MMLAKIHWRSRQEGGRLKPPAGVGEPPYSTMIRFKDSTEPWPPPVGWSLVVEKIGDLGDEFDWVAKVHFLVKEAPIEELRANREFELFEGNRCVASGWLIGPVAAQQ